MSTIDVYADIVCPFAYVGLTRLLQKRSQLGRDDVRFRIRAWPLELVNDAPLDAHFIAEEIDEIRPQVAADLFTGFDVDAFPASTLGGLALTNAAYASDDITGEAVAMDLRRTLFEDGRDVATRAVLDQVAARHGVLAMGTEEAVLAEYAEGRARGVVGSPHFFVGDTSLFCPVLDIKRIDGALRVRVDEVAYDSFLAICFG